MILPVSIAGNGRGIILGHQTSLPLTFQRKGSLHLSAVYLALVFYSSAFGH